MMSMAERLPCSGQVATRLVALSLLWLGACTGERGVGASSVRDSAGVEIVTNRSGSGDPSCVVVDSEAALALGGPDATGPQDLLRAIATRRLSGGRVAVLNASTSEVRFFDSTGAHVLTAGRRGAGPGEFQMPQGLVRAGGDSLLVPDPTLDRLSLIDEAGHVTESRSLRALHGLPIFGRLSDGTLILGAFAPMGADAPTGTRRDTMRVVRLSAAGAVDTLGAFLGSEVVAREFSEGGRRGMGYTMLPFGRSTFVVARGDRLFVGDNAAYRIRVYAAEGRLARIIESDQPARPVTAADIEQEKARQTRGVPNPEFLRLVEEQYDRDRLPPTRPPFSRLQVDDTGWLWVRRYVTAADTAAVWDVFDDTGRLRCSVRLGARFRVDDIGRDYILGVARDEDDVEQVRLYRLRRGP